MKSLFAAGISGSALLLLLGLLHHRRNIRVALGGGWWLAAFVVLIFGANLSVVLFPGRTSYPLGGAALLFLACACAASRLDHVLGGRSAWQRAAWGLFGALIGWCFVVDVTTRPGIVGDRWITYAVAAIVWLGTGLLAAGTPLRPAGLAYAGAALLAILTLPAVAVDSFWTPCNQLFEKCSPAGQLFRGFASSENYIAIVAAFTFIAALSALRGVLRVLAIANSGVVLAATGSRTGMVAVAAAVGVIALLAVLRRRGCPVDRIPRTLCLLLSAAAVTTALTLIFSANTKTLSNRGSIWIAVRNHVDDHLLAGVGVSKWSYFQEVGESPQHFFHSGYALALFSGGVVAVVLLGAWLFCLLRGSVGVPTVAAVVPLMSLFMIYSTTEVIWNPLAVDGLSWLAVGLSCLIGSTSSATAPRPATLVGAP